ncbi:MAG: MoxR family ATPase, partial [Desulfobacteraceae bacterium]|nr:MoxR family ATPase [Desulfobacteraceae bacterium]
LGSVLYWPITTRSSLLEGLYNYDAIGRLQESQLLRSEEEPGKKKKIPDIGQFIRLGPLGTALLPSNRPRVLLIDEIDKSDIDLPNDLLNIFEEGGFEIPELSRLSESFEQVKVFPHDGQDKVTIVRGRVLCNAFPFAVLTSNAERELPAPFLRRCLRLDIGKPDLKKLEKIVEAHFDKKTQKDQDELISAFMNRQEKGDLATDQLLNAIYLTTQGVPLPLDFENKEKLINDILKYLKASHI